MISTIVSIATGGALGALARHGVNVAAVHAFGHGFPWGTLIVNILGSFLMGALIGLLGQFWQPSDTVRIFMVTGFLGAFTTFSTFSLDAVTLWGRGEVWYAGSYMLGSVILSVAALMAGLWVIRSFVS